VGKWGQIWTDGVQLGAAWFRSHQISRLQVESWSFGMAADSSGPLHLSVALHTSCAGERKTPVFFVGGFLAENRRAWEIISRSFRNLDCGPALFLRHADFLGALGCLGATIEGKGDL